MNRLFSNSTWSLWCLLLLVLALKAAQAAGLDSHLPPGVAFSRLILFNAVTFSEFFLAIGLLGAVLISRSKPDWIVVALSLVAIACALYHMFYFLIGIEWLLLYGACSLIREYCRRA